MITVAGMSHPKGTVYHTRVLRPSTIMASMVKLEDFEEEAKKQLDRNAWGYYSSGATTEQSLKDNVDAYSRYMIRPRVLYDTSRADTRTIILGEEILFPVCVAPTAMQCMAHCHGEMATARAAAKAGTCMTLSSWSTASIEEVAQCSGRGLRWFQLYIYRDRELTKQLVHRAQAAGYKALAVTIDTPRLGLRYADVANNFSLPAHLGLKNFDKEATQSALDPKSQGSGLQRYVKDLIDPSLSWETIDWLCSITTLPVLLKGVLRREDVEEALQHNIQGIIVSNHGARQLDGVPATIDALSEVVRAVDGRVEVFLDGGVRHGPDVLKALALGAKAVFIGRPILWGLACKGEEGVLQVLNILRDEFQLTMALAGCNNVNDIHTIPNLVVHRTYYTHPKFEIKCRL